MKYVLNILLVALLVASCGPRKIPRGDMENIMADILVQDQQIKLDKKLKIKADTSLVYEGIFEAYGYDTDDFLYSVEYYLGDPSRMEKIMGAVASRLEREVRLVSAEIQLDEWRKGLLSIYNMKVDTTRKPRPRVRPADTLRVRFEGDRVYLYTIDSIGIRELDTLLFHPADTSSKEPAPEVQVEESAPEKLQEKPVLDKDIKHVRRVRHR